MALAERLFGAFLAAAARPWAAIDLVTGLALLAALPGWPALPVTDRDEARFAQATKQMIETGDLVDIRFQDQPRWKKPIGIYWLQAASVQAVGGLETADIRAWRLPSLLGAVLATGALVWALAPLAGWPGAAVAGAMLATSLLVAAEATIAKTDAVMLALGVLVLGAFLRLTRPGAGTGTAVLFWGTLGVAILIKGPIIPTIAALAWLGWRVFRTTAPGSPFRGLIGVPLAAAIALPWLVAIWIVSDGAFFAEAVGEDLLGKVAEGKESHGAPPGLYLALVWVTFWPWAALIPLAARWAWRSRRGVALVLLAWLVPFWIVLELVPTKLPHYVLPLYPALAGLLAVWLTSARDSTPERQAWWTLAAVLGALPGAVLAIAAVALPLAIDGRLPILAALLLPLSLLLAGVVFQTLRARRPMAFVPPAAALALSVFWAVLQSGLPALQTAFPSPQIAALAEPWRACASGPLVSIGYREPSLVFLTETGTRLPTTLEAVEIIKAEPRVMVWIEDRRRQDVEARLGPLAQDLVERGRLAYANPNRGSFETGALLTRPDPAFDACDPALGGSGGGD